MVLSQLIENDFIKIFNEINLLLSSEFEIAKKRFLQENIYEYMYQYAKKLFQHKKYPMTLISNGSQRITYSLGNSFCLKLAMNEQGTMSNNKEATILKTFEKNGIFPRFYEIGKWKLCMLVEKVMPLDDSLEMTDRFVKCINALQQWKKCKVGITTYSYDTPIMPIMQIFIDTFNQKNNWKQSLENFIQSEKNPLKLEAAEMLLHPKNAGQKALSDIYKWFIENKKIFPTDLFTLENWGLALRNNQTVPVILDLGTEMSKLFQ